MGNIWRKSFSKKNHSFQTLNEVFSAFCWTSLVGLSKLNPKRPNDILSGSSLFLKLLFFLPSFLDNNWKFWGLLSKKFRWARQTCILRVHRNSFKKWIFPNKYCFPSFQDIEHKNFVLLLEKFRRGCQNIILRVHRNILMKNLNIQSINISGIQRKNCGFVSKTFSAQPSKLNSRCQYENYEEMQFCEKKLVTFGHWATSLRTFVKRNNWSCQNSVLLVHRKFWWTNFWKKTFSHFLVIQH